MNSNRAWRIITEPGRPTMSEFALAANVVALNEDKWFDPENVEYALGILKGLRFMGEELGKRGIHLK